jgi:hypothetical protein
MSNNICLNLFALGCLVLTSPIASAREDKSAIAFKSPTTITSEYKPIKLTRTYNDDTNLGNYQLTLQITPNQSLPRVTVDVPEGMEMPEAKNIYVFEPTDPESLLPQYSARNIPAQISQQNRTIGLDFDSSLSHGQTITIEFTKMQTPEVGGTHLLGINAFQYGLEQDPQFVGYASLVFHN